MSTTVMMTTLGTGFVSGVPSDDWMNWECPGFPCFIVNYYESPTHYDNIMQTCTPTSASHVCANVTAGVSFPTTKTTRYNWTDHTVTLGWHNLSRPHPCEWRGDDG